MTTPQGIRKYFEVLLNDSTSATAVPDTAVVVTGLDTVTWVHNGNPISAKGRVTFVIAKRGPDWQIVHFHRSAMPN